MIERSGNGGATAVDKKGFSKKLGELFTEVHESGLSLGKIGVGALLQKVLVLSYLHRVKLEPKFISVVVAIGVIEGLGRRLDPDIDILACAAPHVLKALLRMSKGE